MVSQSKYMELNFNVDKRPPHLLPVLLILKVCHFAIFSFIITIRKENYYIWGQISTLEIDPQRFPCWKLTPFGITFQRARQFSTIGWCYFAANFSGKMTGRVIFHWGSIFNVTAVARRVIWRPPEEINYLAVARRVIWRPQEELSCGHQKIIVIWRPEELRG